MVGKITIGPAQVPGDIESVRDLFVEYQQWLGVDLCFQGFDEELATLPGKYGAPQGRILLAKEEDNVAGGVALRPLGNDVCEMKRLYVREPWRGQGLGRRLAEEIVSAGRKIGYAAMQLDTEKRLREAITLYLDMGFVEIGAYYENPLADILYLEKKLN